MIALTVAALAVLLIWPAPAVLARVPLALRHPAVALVLWQAVGLASGLALIGAGVAHAFESPLWTGSAALVASVGFACYLLAVAASVLTQTLRQRRRHRLLLDLVGDPLPALPGGRLLESPSAMAYCLPGLQPRMVITSAALASLTPSALAAVVAHESAHLRQRHDLVVLPFVAWQAALPFLPGARTARAAVALLVEALADDAARAQIGGGPLREALTRVGMAGSADYTATPSIDVRLGRF